MIFVRAAAGRSTNIAACSDSQAGALLGLNVFDLGRLDRASWRGRVTAALGDRGARQKQAGSTRQNWAGGVTRLRAGLGIARALEHLDRVDRERKELVQLGVAVVQIRGNAIDQQLRVGT